MNPLNKDDLKQMNREYFQSLDKQQLLEVAVNLHKNAMEQQDELEQNSSHKQSSRIKKFWWLLEYKPRWGLTSLAWLVLTCVTILTGLMGSTKIHSFLAVSEPIEAEVLIVEGWADDPVLVGAIAEFERGNYQLILTTGGPVQKGSYLGQYKSFAELAAATLIALRVPPERVVAIPTPQVKLDRTAASARAVKQWLAQANLEIRAVNIYSYDAHTRRSWWIFKSILKPEIEVGAIAHPSSYYDSEDWFTSSTGFRTVLSEAIAYIYARFVWQP